MTAALTTAVDGSGQDLFVVQVEQDEYTLAR